MALIAQDFTLDITPGVIPPVVPVSEYDVGRAFVVMLKNRGYAFQIPSGTTAVVEGKIAGHPFRANATPSGSNVTFELTESMTAYAGRAWTKIKLTKDGKPVSTCGFWLDVDRAGVEAGDVIGSSGFEEQIQGAVNAWIDANPPDYGIDKTLSVSDEAADARVVGERFARISEFLFPSEAKALLITILRHALYESNMKVNIDNLENILSVNPVSGIEQNGVFLTIKAVFAAPVKASDVLTIV